MVTHTVVKSSGRLTLHRSIDRSIERQRQRQTETHRERQTERQRDRETETERQRDRDRETERQRQRDRQRERELVIFTVENLSFIFSTNNLYNSLLLKACVNYFLSIFYFSANDSPSKTIKMFFISSKKPLLVLKIFRFLYIRLPLFFFPCQPLH